MPLTLKVANFTTRFPLNASGSLGSVAACALAAAADEKAIDRPTNEIMIVSGEMDNARHDPIETRSRKVRINGGAASRLKCRPGAVDGSMDTRDVHRVDQHREWIGFARSEVIYRQGLSLGLINHRLKTPRDASGSSSLRQIAPPARPGGARSGNPRLDDGPVRLTALVEPRPALVPVVHQASIAIDRHGAVHDGLGRRRLVLVSLPRNDTPATPERGCSD